MAKNETTPVNNTPLTPPAAPPAPAVTAAQAAELATKATETLATQAPAPAAPAAAGKQILVKGRHGYPIIIASQGKTAGVGQIVTVEWDAWVEAQIKAGYLEEAKA